MATLLDVVKLFVQHTGRYDLLQEKIDDALYNATELITNPGLEGSYVAGVAPNWTKVGTGLTCTEETTSLSTAPVGTTKAQRLAYATGSGTSAILLSSAVTLTRGKWYKIKFYYKVVSGAGIAEVGFYDPTFAETSGPTLQITTGLTATSWTLAEYDIECQLDTTTYKMGFSIGGASASTVVIDAVSVKEISGGPDARWYIRQAIDFLDQQQETPQSEAWHVETIAAGDYSIVLENCRAVLEVWAKGADTGRGKLIKKSLSWIRENYPNHPDDTDQGAPMYWTPYSPRQAPEQQGDALSTVDGEDLIQYSPEGSTAILLTPPSDDTYTVRILGKFYSRPLTYDVYTNWWTTNKPWVVVWTAKFILEGALRSSKGMQDLQAFLMPYLKGIDFDLVEQDIVDVTEMEG